MFNFILASSSPRRQTLLKQIGLPFEVCPSGADETIPEGTPPEKMVEELAICKGLFIRPPEVKPFVIISADTVVSIDGRVLGKPRDKQDACDMLEMLQGRRHRVYTGVALIKKDGVSVARKSFVETADVYMRSLSRAEIKRYVETGEPMDKAGAYGVQELGAVLVERVEGDYHTVVGLPLAALCGALLEWGIDYMIGWPRK